MHKPLATYWLWLLPLLVMGNLCFAQSDEVTFETKLSKEKLGVNERLRVEFTMNKNGDNFNAPNFSGFKVIMGPSLSTRSSWINGKRSYSQSYTYILQPQQKGNLKIGQATIEIGGKTFKSALKNVIITDAVENPNAPRTADDVADENLHLVAEVSKNNPYLNEAVTVVYKLYISPSISVTNYRPLDNPKYNSFWSQDIPVTKYNTQNSTFQGKPYRSVVLKRVVLYPQKTGRLTIEPLSLEIYVDVPTDRRDFFGGRIYKQASKTVSAGKRTLNVKSLPENGKPASFNGAVGDFDFKVTTSKSDLNASESLQAKVEVTGKGNLKLFQLPEPSLPSALEVYEPEFEESVRTTLTGMEGKVSNSYTIVPASKGKYPIPSIAFSFFNPKTGKYATLNSDEITINVLEGPTNSNTVSSTNEGLQKIVIPEGEQFHFIKLTPGLTSLKTNYFFGSRRFYLYLLLPLLLIPLVIFLSKKRKAKNADVAGNKIRKANRLAKKYLSAAKKQLGNKEAFYVALERALHNYLKAKLKIETFEFSKEKIAELLNEKSVDEDSITGFLELLKNCEMARYSPFSNVQMQQDYDKASNVITQMDKRL